MELCTSKSHAKIQYNYCLSCNDNKQKINSSHDFDDVDSLVLVGLAMQIVSGAKHVINIVFLLLERKTTTDN